jgi:hypothetical protein
LCTSDQIATVKSRRVFILHYVRRYDKNTIPVIPRCVRRSHSVCREFSDGFLEEGL